MQGNYSALFAAEEYSGVIPCPAPQLKQNTTKHNLFQRKSTQCQLYRSTEEIWFVCIRKVVREISITKGFKQPNTHTEQRDPLLSITVQN